tara:strand:- start:236 stop:676 length:441 start_codon:yes stop_codon:yes gene_type:complete
MFSIDSNNFPIIIVKLIGNLEPEEDFDNFLNYWLQLYEQERDFTFYFDTTEVTTPPLKYCIKMSKFIKELRQNEIQYLQKSIILINENKIKWMLDFIFWIQPPVATVYIYHTDNGLTENISENIETIMNHSETDIVESGKPFLPIF